MESEPCNCSTRLAALEWLVEMLERRGRTLVGFDFAFGYPAGFASAHRMGAGAESDRAAAWLRTARHLAGRVEESARNQNNRHAVASALNRAIGGGPGPFWGCHENASTEDLRPGGSARSTTRTVVSRNIESPIGA